MAELLAAAVPRPDPTGTLLADVRRRFGVSDAFAVSSGKAALAITLRALHGISGRRKVILPAYTCYSVPSAIVKAGLDPVPCDLAPGSFDYDYRQLQGLLDGDVLCVLSVHLFGIRADTSRVAALCRPMDIFVVEDAAQAFGASSGGRPLGTTGDAAIFSLGRGKTVTTGSGGLIVSDSRVVADGIREIVKDLPRRDLGDGLSAFVGLALLSVFIAPQFFWFPSGLPFLKLGETIFHEDFAIRRLSSYQARLLRRWEARVERLSEARRLAADYYLDHLPGARNYCEGVGYLRFPLMLECGARRRILEDPSARRLGISRMYPATVGRIPQLQTKLRQKEFPQAEKVAAGLITLPTHPLLTRTDLRRICELVNAARAPGNYAPTASPSDPLAAVHH